MMRIVLFFFLSILNVGSVISQSVTSYAYPDSLYSGDTFTFVITTRYTTGDFIGVYPDANQFKDPFEFRAVQRFKGVLAQDSLVYQLQFFGVSDTLLSDIVVKFVQGSDTLELTTPPVVLYFKSNLASSDDTLKPIKPIFEFARSWWILMLIGIVLSALVWFLWRYRGRFSPRNQPLNPSEPVAIAPFVSPFTILERRIRELHVFNNYSYEDGLVKWHVELSDAIRTYFEQTYSIPALESTTKEIRLALQSQKINADIIAFSLDILYQSDLVKFANVQPNTHQCIQLIQKADKLKDLVRFMDESKLRDMRIQYEIVNGLRQPDADVKQQVPTADFQHEKQAQVDV
jgi:hypothetical protein